ncbi:MAG TPA: hypothetical protein VII78_08620 [Myxococcota bacterium]|jgi:hypothetical protein
MTPRIRALVVLACSSAALGATCGGTPPPAPPRVVAPPPATELVMPTPPAEVTICQRDARPTSGGDAAVVASFEQFSRDWIGKMKAVANARFATERKRLRNTYEMDLRATGSAQAPWVGVLSYCEVALKCETNAETSCRPSSSVVVKEMFRYQAGQWVY